MDLFPQFNDLLRQKNSPPLKPYVFRVQDVDSFLQEAYSINKSIAELTTYLRSIRQSYLSAQSPPRRKQITRTQSNSNTPHHDTDRKYLTDAERNEIDASAKQCLRGFNSAVSKLSEAEQHRQSIDYHIALKKRTKGGLGAIGRWAAGGAITAKSPEELEQEQQARTLKMHRESVVWYLQRKLEECGRIQSEMMEIRITREVEKSKSALYKARGAMAPSGDFSSSRSANGFGGSIQRTGDHGSSTALDDEERRELEQELTPEQLQLFSQENQDMLKHYEVDLDKVKTAEKSLIEIAELQTTITSNLAIQEAHIEQFVEDSFAIEENVGKGNKELKRATERKSTARMIFYSTSVFCLTLVVWDLLI